LVTKAGGTGGTSAEKTIVTATAAVCLTFTKTHNCNHFQHGNTTKPVETNTGGTNSNAPETAAAVAAVGDAPSVLDAANQQRKFNWAKSLEVCITK